MVKLPLVGGLFCLVIGVYFFKIQVRRLMNRKPGSTGFNFRLLLYGIVFIIAGVLLLLKRI